MRKKDAQYLVKLLKLALIKKIKEARIKQGMSQRDLAKKLEVSQVRICHLENIKNKNTSIDYLLFVLARLGVVIEWRDKQ